MRIPVSITAGPKLGSGCKKPEGRAANNLMGIAGVSENHLLSSSYL